MSAGNKETQQDTACPGAAAPYFSNPLMSDVEADWSPIHDAAFNGNVLSLQRLIAQGVCVNLNTLDQVSPLHVACLQGHTNCAKLLVEKGANVNHTTLDGHTALTEASARGHVSCVSLLLKHGATPPGEATRLQPGADLLGRQGVAVATPNETIAIAVATPAGTMNSIVMVF